MKLIVLTDGADALHFLKCLILRLIHHHRRAKNLQQMLTNVIYHFPNVYTIPSHFIIWRPIQPEEYNENNNNNCKWQRNSRGKHPWENISE